MYLFLRIYSLVNTSLSDFCHLPQSNPRAKLSHIVGFGAGRVFLFSCFFFFDNVMRALALFSSFCSTTLYVPNMFLTETLSLVTKTLSMVKTLNGNQNAFSC